MTHTFTFTGDKHIRFVLEALIDIALEQGIADWRKWVDSCAQRAVCPMIFQGSIETFGGDELLRLRPTIIMEQLKYVWIWQTFLNSGRTSFQLQPSLPIAAQLS